MLFSQIVFVGVVPVVEDAAFFLLVVADLDGDVGVGVAVVEVAAFVGLEELDEDFTVVPGGRRDIGVDFVVALKGGVEGICVLALVVLVDEVDNFLRAVFKPLHIEGDLGADHMLGIEVRFGRVGVGVVLGAAVAAGDDNFLAGLRLYIIDQFN